MRESALPMPSTAADVPDLAQLCAVGMGIFAADRRLRWFNPALGEYLGLAGQRLPGESLAWRGRAGVEVAEAIGRAQADQRRVLLRGAHLDGAESEVLVADLAFTPLDAGEVLFELTALAATPSAAPRLSESLRGFAHEVKNPLAGVRGAAQLLLRRVEAPDLADLARLIIAEADRLAALADRLLRSSGKPRLSRMNIHELLERVAGLVAAESATPVIRRDYDPSLPLLNGDRDRLCQLLLNLARNAVAAGARTLTLRSRVERGARLGERPGLALRVDIQDDGCGVPPDIEDSLFQPLVSGRAGGSGLGLALAREIAHEHGGELRHAGRPGATVFTLLLPLPDAAGRES
jgi:two-component system nitrogen regulation sensor histidine kinase GlnL